jgi:glycosyltransferase involved in cell wall biosynthesis
MSTAILHVLGTAELEGSSVARIVGELAAGLGRPDYCVHACFLGASGPLLDELRGAGTIVQNINWTLGVRDPIGAGRFWRYLRKHNFSIVHQHFGARSVRRLIKATSQARLIVHLHGGIDEASSVHDIPIAVRGADVIIAPSRSVALQVVQLNPVLVYAGVHTPDKRAGVLRSGPELIVIGTACRLVPLKGVLELLQAMAVLLPEFPNLRLEIAGRGPQQGDLEREACLIGLTDHIRFLGWQRDLRPVLRSWDIFALPSLDEAFPLVVLDAMSEGLPVVGTSVGGLPELIEDGRTGFLVPPRDSAALARQLRRLVLEPELRWAQGVAGRESARNRFSVDRMVAQIEEIYDAQVQILRRGQKPAG